jgi:VIT1/CCC1 family predicted Fe2+/Mn2+ transporter
MPVGIKEHHHTDRIGWLRAAVLGANDGILSTSSLVLGVAAAHATHRNLLVAGMAGLVAGAMSMAAGEYVSVHSQSDTERADLDIERVELKADNKGEHKELGGDLHRSWARSYSRETGCSATDGPRRVGRPRQR